MKQISKFISLILRHKPELIGLTLDENGWANVDELIEKSNTNDNELTLDLLKQIVEENDKQRFTFNEDYSKIRANQGHTVKVDLELESTTPPEFLYHGTVEKFIDSIKENGLKPIERLHVHLSKDIDTAKNVGSRRGSPIILKIQSLKMHENNHVFYLSKNGVWLCDAVPTEYIQF